MSAEDAASALTFLIVEDDPRVANTLTRIVRRDIGARVEVANTLLRARRALDGSGPTAVLLDVVLPDGRSLDLAGEIAKKNIPLLLMTGDPEEIRGAVNRAHQLDANVLAKPFGRDDVLRFARRAALRGEALDLRELVRASVELCALDLSLSPLQHEVLAALLDGVGRKGMPAHFARSDNTIKQAIRGLLGKPRASDLELLEIAGVSEVEDLSDARLLVVLRALAAQVRRSRLG